MKCIVVDDEPFALELAAEYVKKTPFLELVGTFTNPFKALSFMMEQEVHLLFLDINMPELSGIQLLNSLPHKPMVVFTTAYPEYGAESYEYNAVDYLLKPINYVRFLRAANKALELWNLKKQPQAAATASEQAPVTAEKEYVLIKSGTQTFKVKVEDILYVEGAGNYMSFYTKGKKILSLLSMKEVLDLLPNDQFVRVHKSYVVSLRHLQVIERHQVLVEGKPIPLGLTYREQFLEKAGKKG
ncbi:LytTR family two component transcriptional regulator [Pontibacter ummariensis]|uniref:Two component transcriptional regulator, LytTR family n=1 Tax=Pontibacter ummariensis TaxID=1610492 RepID=A0A239DBK6_9BACT|nr:LytTR family DNA-binding domain-containing protein [Pontibacter ummariensis]PRY14325.1 LytTR family two component transcriptional regulator [Pontibacter ummariensis]SNS29234.1 two component transcriptional regulator, LytTR family [Pontibacter ummariensis]